MGRLSNNLKKARTIMDTVITPKVFCFFSLMAALAFIAGLFWVVLKAIELLSLFHP